jgi:hypothetical protein
LNEAAVSAGDTAYGGLPEELTLGLSWEEWQKTRQFNAIYTWALREERKGKFVGCLSLDCTYSRGVELIPMTAAANEVSALVGLLAKAVAFPDRVRALPLSALLDKLKELGASDRLLDFAKKSRRR